MIPPALEDVPRGGSFCRIRSGVVDGTQIGDPVGRRGHGHEGIEGHNGRICAGGSPGTVGQIKAEIHARIIDDQAASTRQGEIPDRKLGDRVIGCRARGNPSGGIVEDRHVIHLPGISAIKRIDHIVEPRIWWLPWRRGQARDRKESSIPEQFCGSEGYLLRPYAVPLRPEEKAGVIGGKRILCDHDSVPKPIALRSHQKSGRLLRNRNEVGVPVLIEIDDREIPDEGTCRCLLRQFPIGIDTPKRYRTHGRPVGAVEREIQDRDEVGDSPIDDRADNHIVGCHISDGGKGRRRARECSRFDPGIV